MQILKKILTFILIIESRLIIAKYKPFIIAVTGTVGKTSTKDAIYTVLKDQFGYVRKSEKSMNSEIGLPLTVIGAPNAWKNISGWLNNIWKGFALVIFRNKYPNCLVLEVGADHPNDIRNIAVWLKPDISIITKVGATPVHVEFFKTIEDVFIEKSYLAKYTKKNGAVILYADEPKVLTIADMVKNNNVSIIKFGLDQGADVRGSNGHVIYQEQKPRSYGFTVTIDQNNFEIITKNVLGDTYIYPCLCALSVVKSLKLDLQKAVNALNSYEAPRGRMNVIEGINDSTIIDDTYNSSPDAVISALKTLKSVTTNGKKIAILGDMLELGKYSSEQHRMVGREVVGIVDLLITVGGRSKSTADEAISKGFNRENVMSFDRSSDLASKIANYVGQNDVVLIKGSQSIRMERVSKALLKEPQKADRLLVRQEKEWLMKE
jgi:UDP-N-acetylmuramoyl-tripeptide--D-alanyl-D-alanine ligase